MRKHGFYAEGFSVVGTDAVHELDGLAQNLFHKYPQVYFWRTDCFSGRNIHD